MKLLVGPMEEALRLCEAHRPSHLVSWVSPPAIPVEIPPAFGPERRLLLASHDLIEPMEGLEPPSADHVAELLAFARSWSGERPMLVHCWAGVSRSTAAAYVVACQARPLASERELALRLRELSPTATPNLLIVRHADTLLGRDGRMVDAVAAIGRGAETMLGAPFTLDL